MDRVRRLVQLWPYLPAFRAVAETQHLPRASEQLFVSPSALSRSIRLLEETVGTQLFDRVGRQLELNAAGQRFLSAVRDAMRLLDEGLAQVTAEQFVGPVRVSAPSPWRVDVLVPVLDELRVGHPELVPSISSLPADAVPGALLQGRLDVALVTEVEAHEDLSAHLLTELPCRLFARPDADASTLAHAVAEAPGADVWPAHVPRTIGLRADLGTITAACATGRYVAALPEAWGTARDLAPVESPALEPLRLLAVQRRSLGIPGRADAVIEALTRHLA